MSSLTIEQQIPGMQIIALYEGNKYKLLNVVCYALNDDNIPKPIKNLAKNTNIVYFLVAEVEKKDQSDSFSISGEMSLVSNDLVNDGMVVVYDVVNKTVVEHVPVLGDVKLGGGDE